MSDEQCSSSGDSDGDYHTCDEDENEKSGVPRAASPSSSSSEDGRDPSYYYHTSDEDEAEDEDVKLSAPPTTPHNEDGRKQEEEEEELDVLGAAPVVAVRTETRQLHTRSVTGLEQCFQKMLQSREQPNTQLVPSGSQEDDEILAVASGSCLRGYQNTTLNVQLNLTQQQFGDVTVEKATHINQSFGGSQNISTTATRDTTRKEPSRADRIMERTIKHFKAWNQSMVKTDALHQVMEKLKSGTTWLTIKGNPGEGKTTVGFMALEELHELGREVFEVRSPDEFTEVIETCSRPVIMLDDVFGNLEFDQAEWSRWKPAVSPLLKEREHKSHETEDTTSKKDVTVILIGRDYVLNSASANLGRMSDFLTSEKHVISMEHSMKRSIEEKRAIWETISEAGGVELDKKKVEEILRISVAHGFPHVCRLFTTICKKNKSFDAVEFFTKPLEFLNESVSNLFNDTSKLKLFREMIKGEGKICIRELIELDRTSETKQIADTLVGTYIKVEGNSYLFDHPSIYDSVAFHMCSRNPEFVIQQCHLSFIHERVRISFSQDNESSNDSGLVVYVNRCYVDDLAERFANEIMARNFFNVLSHQAFTDRAFVGMVMERLTKPMKSLLHLTVHNSKTLFSTNTFIELVPSSRSPELLKYIDNCQDIRLTANDERNILYWTCRYAASDVLTYLVKTRKPLDINAKVEYEYPLLVAAETRDAQFVHKILSLNPDLNARDREGRTIVHLLIKYKLVSPLREVIERGVDIDVQSNAGKSPLCYACNDNYLEGVKLLIEKGAKVDKTSFIAACGAGNLQIVQLLIEKGAKVDEESLHAACRVGRYDIVLLLFEKGTNICEMDILNKCLSLALESCNTDIMQFLVDRGASVNSSSSTDTIEELQLHFHFPDICPQLHIACLINKPHIVKWLLQKGADIKSTDSAGYTALHKAAWMGSYECVDLLLKADASVDVQSTKGETALQIKAGIGSYKCVGLLLKASASVNLQNINGDTALHRAAESGSKECVDLLQKAGATVDKQNKEGNTALHKAAGRGSKECVDLLQKAGASVNIQNKEGDTALHRAAGRGSKECVGLFLKAGASVNIENKEGNTALHRAAERGSEECVDLLLKAKASVNIQNKEGNTALHRAAESGSKECVGLLLKAGANVDIRNKQGDTALFKAVWSRSNECVDLLLKAGATVDIQNKEYETERHLASYEGVVLPPKEDSTMSVQNKKGDTTLHRQSARGYNGYVDFLLKSGDKQNKESDTALHRAAERGYNGYVDFLLKSGAAVDKQNKEGNTALHRAAEIGSEECIDLLWKAGATVDIQNIEGDTALHRAAERVSIDCLDLLLKAGASVNINNKEGNTALHRAAERGSEECVDLLQKAGATVDKQNIEGDTALHRAAERVSIDCLDLLLKAGATVNVHNKEGNTPLHSAVYPFWYKQPSTSVCQALIQHGASVNIQNTEGDTPLHILSKNILKMYFHDKDSQMYKDMAHVLIARGADVAILNKQGKPALYGWLRRLLKKHDCL